MSHVLLLDTNVWSHLVLGDAAKSGKIKAQLAALRLKYPGSAMATSGICIAECMVAARRLLDLNARMAAEAAFQREFDRENLMVVDVTPPILDKAASLRAEALRRAAAIGGAPAGPDGGKLKLPDAVIAATCMDFDPAAILVTENVGDFQYIENGLVKTVSGLTVEAVG
jgi:predicted nucleic acid-binding protein